MRRISSIIIVGCACIGMMFGDSFTIFNTGVDSGGTPLVVAAGEIHYSLISAPAGVPLTPFATTPNAAWVPNSATADWISPGASGNTNWPVGDYDYRITFNLAGFNPATAGLTGDWASDNNASISLNGVSLPILTGFADFGAAASFGIFTGFQPGANTLDFIVTNGGGPTGLFVDNLVGTASPVSPSTIPEPSSIMLLGSGLLGLMGVLRRRAAKL